MGSSGPGAGLEARFRPSAHWGAEFLSAGVRLCAMGRGDGGDGEGKPGEVRTFTGTYAEADAFASAEGLAHEGLHAAVSHLPFKLESMPPAAEGSEEDPAAYAERVRPQGLPAESLDIQEFEMEGGRILALMRADALQGFAAGLPASLGAIWDLAPTPIALLPHVDAALARGNWAALWAEADFLHVLFFRDAGLLAYAKLFSGWEEAGREPIAFARELKKALVYHFGSRFAGASLDGLQVWNDGPAEPIAASLKGLGIPQFRPDWGPLAAVPPAFRAAAALALRAARGDEASGSFAITHPAAAYSRRQWMGRAGKVARVGALALAGLALVVALFAVSAAVLRFTVQAKARAWSADLGRWDALQKRKAEVERDLGGMQGILSRRTAAFAVLQDAAARVPAEAWLETWELESKGGKRYTQRLEGYALSEARVPEFLANLEKTGTSGSWKLKSTERIKGETVEQKTGIKANHKDLVRFQVGTAQ